MSMPFEGLKYKNGPTSLMSEHKDEKLASRRRSPIFGSVAELGHKAFAIPLWLEDGNLYENVLSEMHIYSKFDLDSII